MKKTFLYVLISTFMFSSMEIALKSVGNAFSPIQLNLIRFFVGGLVLLPIVLKNKNTVNNSKWKSLGIFSLTGFLCVVFSMTLYQLAIVYDQAATVAVLFSCNPVFAILFAFIILREKINRLGLISLVISIIGLLIIVNPANLTNPLGLTLALGSALTFGLYSIVSRWGSFVSGYGGLALTCYTFLAGSIELFVLILITHIPFVANFMNSVSWLKSFANTPVLQNVNLHYFWMLLFICVCVTGGGFAFYFLAMDRAGVSIASLVFFIKPGLAPILAMMLIGEKISLNTWIGIIVILIGSVITFIGSQLEQKESDLKE
ncbi:DMT family transporter [Apilactobacillus micheneri]|uniref:DMT family transporter n=1 Tax=Apilactobacillus micheneri TaxID=1899430 RepID=A0A2S2JMD5_9LACO|nr:DMT family transporter [Apilactobacillus micheneri]TPR38735.1 DMT family transporter [Apilactobacillus micheneri]TPR41226.1 DMT family transporter [Apilactobacillus micheneri]TPR42378.1 DMT family transporter [Apilactobacillus micheneri]TPR42774.1 DMT family transporter [Apilactobacillus micheneri]TPR43542.1 DMT family transporter [Apilactobacillus micheneri]